MQVTSILTLRFGSRVALVAIVYASIASAIVGLGIVRISVRTGYGMNLLARRVLGFRGAFLFSLMFGVNSVIYFAAEATIMGSSLRQLFPHVALSIVLPTIALAMMPLVWFGIKVLAKLQFLTFILYGVLLVCALYISIVAPASDRDWLNYMPSNAPAWPIALVAAIGTMNSVLFTGGLVSADYARFVRRSDIGIASLFVGVGFQAFCFAFSGLLGLWFAVRYLDNNPGSYFVTMLAGWGTVFAIATQLRINLTNMYSGSMSFLNVFRQVANLEVSRHLMVVLFGVGCALAMMSNLLSNLTVALGVIGMFMTCFTCLVLVDVYILRPISHEEAGASAGPDWRWGAVVSLVAATACGGFLQMGMFGPAAVSMASLIAAAGQTGLYLMSSNRGRKRQPVAELGS
ncbi:purine-cytosine permease family protein [Lichenicoccus sp.]|uniref:purine-cytosine permease family protein n=1 Tax=Lichenicoccus sp. TaxID=2781899 RepID=UPI003D135141